MLFKGGESPEETYNAKDDGAALLVAAALLKGVDPPRYYNGQAKSRCQV